MTNGTLIIIAEVVFYAVLIGGFYIFMKLYDWRQSKKKAQEVP